MKSNTRPTSGPHRGGALTHPGPMTQGLLAPPSPTLRVGRRRQRLLSAAGVRGRHDSWRTPRAPPRARARETASSGGGRRLRPTRCRAQRVEGRAEESLRGTTSAGPPLGCCVPLGGRGCVVPTLLETEGYKSGRRAPRKDYSCVAVAPPVELRCTRTNGCPLLQRLPL
eukprot:scaffold7446_cov403-Prasinococcus_capsulatus_cf.AAC.8